MRYFIVTDLVRGDLFTTTENGALTSARDVSGIKAPVDVAVSEIELDYRGHRMRTSRTSGVLNFACVDLELLVSRSVVRFYRAK